MLMYCLPVTLSWEWLELVYNHHHMDVSGIISLFRTRCHNVSTTAFSDTKALELANYSYQKVIATIRSEVNEDFMRISGQEHSNRSIWVQFWYTLRWCKPCSSYPQDNKGSYQVQKWCWLCTRSPYRSLWDDNGWLDNDTGKSLSSNVSIQWLSINIFPAPTEVVTAWLKVYGLYNPIPLTLSTVEANIWVPPEWHETITTHMRYMYYETIGQLDKRAAAYNDMLEEESRMIARMSNRTNGQQESQLPNLSYFSLICSGMTSQNDYLKPVRQ